MLDDEPAQKSYSGYKSFIQINGKTYEPYFPFHLALIDGENMYGLNWRGLAGLISYHNDIYTIREHSNPYIDGTFAFPASALIRKETVHISSTESYDILSFNNKNKSYTFMPVEDFLPIDEVLDALDIIIDYSIEINEGEKTLIFILK